MSFVSSIKTALDSAMAFLAKEGFWATHVHEGRRGVLLLRPEDEMRQRVLDHYKGPEAQGLLEGIARILDQQRQGIFGHRPRHWVFYVDARSDGGLESLDMARNVARRAEQASLPVAVVQASQKRLDRLEDISDKIIAGYPNITKPMGILVFGGDALLSDALSGVMHYFYGSAEKFAGNPPTSSASNMLKIAVALGVIGDKRSTDLGKLYESPNPHDPEAIFDFINTFSVEPLNLGAVFLGGLQDTRIFAHSAVTGASIAATHPRLLKSLEAAVGVADDQKALKSRVGEEVRVEYPKMVSTYVERDLVSHERRFRVKALASYPYFMRGRRRDPDTGAALSAFGGPGLFVSTPLPLNGLR